MTEFYLSTAGLRFPVPAHALRDENWLYPHLSHIPGERLWDNYESVDWTLEMFEREYGVRPPDPQMNTKWRALRSAVKMNLDEIWHRMSDEDRAEIENHNGPWGDEWLLTDRTYREYFHMPTPPSIGLQQTEPGSTSSVTPPPSKGGIKDNCTPSPQSHGEKR